MNQQLIQEHEKKNIASAFLKIHTDESFIHMRNTNGTIQNETYIYVEGNVLAKIDNEGNKFFYHNDHLGSTTLVTNESGATVSEIFYLPYGCILTDSNGNQRYKFTGKGNEK